MLLSVLFVAFIHKSHSDGQSRSDGQKMKKIHVNKALGPPLVGSIRMEINTASGSQPKNNISPFDLGTVGVI